jgi:hypothetical protein
MLANLACEGLNMDSSPCMLLTQLKFVTRNTSHTAPCANRFWVLEDVSSVHSHLYHL